jgi:thiamine pyrophosphate-dependent acetolactate synthase large subunit-like protein
LLRQSEGRALSPSPKWLPACRHWRERYPIILPEYFDDQKHVNSYVFMDRLADHLKEGDVFVAGNGLDCVTYYQSYKVKVGQRSMISNNWGRWDGTCHCRSARVSVTGAGQPSV